MAGPVPFIDVPLPPEIADTEYAPHIVGALGFQAEDQRLIPAEIAQTLRNFGDSGQTWLDHLDLLSRFLKATFVVDDFTDYRERDAMRGRFEHSNPQAHAWYENHFLRQNKLSTVILAMQGLQEIAQPVFKRTSDPTLPTAPTLENRLEDLAADAFIRWKKLEGAPRIDTLALISTKIDFLENRLAPLVQDVFDCTVFALNRNQPIGTLPDGRVSMTMTEITDTYAFVSAARRLQLPAPDQPDPDPEPQL